MSQTEAQLAFQARISRITQANGGSVSVASQGKSPRKRSRAVNMLLVPPLMLFSLALGAGAVFATRLMRFYQGEAGLKYDMVVLDASISVVMLVVLSGIFQLRDARYGRCMALGAAAMMTCMHNLVWTFPFFFADLFSHAYVGVVKRETDPMTIWLWVTSLDIPNIAIPAF